MKTWKVFLGIGVSLLIVGIIVFLIGLGLNNWKFKVEYEMKTFNSTQENTAPDLNLAAGEMNVEFYEGDSVEVTYPTSAAYGYEVSEFGGTVKVASRRNRFIWFGWYKIPTVTVKIPNDKVMDMNLQLSAGKATVADGTFGGFKVSLSAGDVNAGNIKCADCNVKLSAGSIDVSGLECTKLDLKLSAGSADVGKIKTDYINVKLSAGTANLTVCGSQSEYLASVEKSAGSCNLADQLLPPGAVDNFKHINVSLSAGSVNFYFTD